MKTELAALSRRPLAVAMVVALLAPGAALADTKKEKELEARVAQLEAQVQALLNSQQQQASQLTQTQGQIVQTQGQVSQTQTQLDEVRSSVAKVAATPPAFTTAPGLSMALHGFINVTAFSQSRPFSFGNGQNAEWPLPGSDGSLSGVDLRNTRFWLDVTGGKLSQKWTGGGHLEFDLFGGNNGTGLLSGQQPLPRLRAAYIDLDNADSGTKVRIGQQFDLLVRLDNAPDSVAHVAFPLAFGTGIIGWRYPGVVVMQDLNKGSAGAKWRLDVGAFSGNWSGPGSTTNFMTGGNADFRPQLQARLNVTGDNWLAYALAHYASIDLRGVEGTASTPIKSSIDSRAFGLGGAYRPGRWTLKGFAFTGQAMAPNFGPMLQIGDISEFGGYAQVGYGITKNWSVNAVYGYDNPDDGDVLTWGGSLLRNRQTTLNLIYANGPYKFGLEALHDQLDVATDGGAGTDTISGNQINVSAQYTF